jgi:SAM-dependent methyltransferase
MWFRILIKALKRNGWRQLIFYLSNLDVWRFIEYSIVYQHVTRNRIIGKTIDLGAGYSVFPSFFAGEDYTVIDLGKGACEYQMLHGTKAIAHDMTDLPFETGSINTVIAISSIEHVPDDNAVYSEISRVLSQNGLAVISIPHTNQKTEIKSITYPKWMKNVLYDHDKFWESILGKTNYTYFIEQTSIDTLIRFYNLVELQSILETYNLDIKHYVLFGRKFSRNFFHLIPSGWLVLKDIFFGWPLNKLENIFLNNSNVADGMILLLEKKKQ